MTLLKCLRVSFKQDLHLSSRVIFADQIEPLTYLFEVPLGDVPDADRWSEARNSALDVMESFFTPPWITLPLDDFYDAFLTHAERMESLTRYADILRKTHDPGHPRSAGRLFHRLARHLDQQEAQYQSVAVIEFRDAYSRLPPDILQGEDAAA